VLRRWGGREGEGGGRMGLVEGGYPGEGDYKLLQPNSLDLQVTRFKSPDL